MKKKIFILLGHPDKDTTSGYFADQYERGAREKGHEVRRSNLGELKFDPILHQGYKVIQALEPDLIKAQEDIRWCDHFVILYPSWWSTMPALLKGFFDRMWLPAFAFRFHPNGYFWSRLLKGRTATVFVTSDSPPLAARIIFGDTTNEIRRGILWFAGFRVFVKKIGPMKHLSAEKREKWGHKFFRWGHWGF
jgi:NAD(P)H dehydrogenase (quinone)